MAIRNIVQVGDDVLRKKSFPVTDFGEKTSMLLDDMKETLIKAEGAGLAAPQVGVLRRMFVVMLEDEGYFEFINPKIVSTSGSQTGVEGCLSVKGKWGDVTRPNKLTIEFQDRNAKWHTLNASGFFAKAICHEYDHLDGILYIDKASNVRSEP